MLSLLFTAVSPDMPGTCLTPDRTLERDQMEDLVKLQSPIRGEESAKGSGLDGECKDKCVICPCAHWAGWGQGRSEQTACC